MPQNSQDTKFLFFEALDQPEADRDAFVDKVCGSDGGLRRRIEALLRAHTSAGAFMSQPASDKLSITAIAGETQKDFQLGDKIGNYRLVKVLGEGGFGSVFLAEQESPVVRPVALKILKLGMDTKHVIARFEAERQALALMDHPCIATVLDAGATANGRPYFVMEFVDGKPVTEYCDEHRLPVPERLEIFELVCQAVQHAHQKGVIHRDIKPGNVMVTVVDGRPVPKVIDFGIAKALGSKLTDRTLVTQDRHLVGTPQYMAPEQASLSGIDVDTRTDVYSLGVLLYEILTGTLPFEGKKIKDAGIGELERIIREDRPRKPSSVMANTSMDRERLAEARSSTRVHLQKELSGDLDWIVMRALEKDRTRRYATCYALGADIGRYLRHEPVSAGPPSAAYRFSKLWQRRRVAMIAIGFAIVSMLVASVGTGIFGVMAVQARDDAIEAENESNRLRQIAETQSYIANIFATQGSLSTNDSATARLRLDATPAQMRNWEWQYFDQRLDRSLYDFDPTDGKSSFVEYSPDGDTFVTAWADGSVRIASVETGAELFNLRGHTRQVWDVVFSPDGNRLYAGDDGGDIFVWDLKTGKVVQRWSAHSQRISRLRLVEDGMRLYSSSWDGLIREWNTATGTSRVVLDISGTPIEMLDITPDGSRIAAGAWDQHVWFVNPETAKVVARQYCAWPETQPSAPERWAAGGLRSFTLTPDGRTLLTGARDSRVAAWRMDDGQFLGEPDALSDFAATIACSPDGEYIAAGTYDGVIYLWRGLDFERVSEMRDHLGDVRDVEFTPDSRRLVSTSWDNTIRVWDPESGQELAVYRGHREGVYGTTITPDGQRMITRAEDYQLLAWDLTPMMMDVVDVQTSHILSVCFGRSPNILVSAPRFGKARMIELNTGRIIHELGDDVSGAKEVAANADGSIIATAGTGQDWAISLWDAVTGELINTLPGHRSDVWSMAFDPDGETLASASRDGTARVWDVNTGEEVLRISGQGAEIMWVRYTADGRQLIASTSNGGLRFMDAGTGEVLREVSDPSIGQVRCFAISPDGKRLAYGASDRTLRLINMDNDDPPIEMFGHGQAVVSIAWMPDGTRIVTGSHDRTVRLWDPDLAENVAVLMGHTNLIQSIAVSSDGKSIVSGAEDNTTRIWRVPEASEKLSVN